jgi:hypothetical protein
MSALTGRTKERQERDSNRLLPDPPVLESLDVIGTTFPESTTAPAVEQLLSSTHVSSVLSASLNELKIVTWALRANNNNKLQQQK